MKQIELSEILENTSDLTKEKKVWYIAIVGRPNSWKSTFLNTLIGKKVSITTNTPQTTRRRVLGIYNDDDMQIIFFDTPGIHKSEKEFNKKINEVAISSLSEADVVLYFIDSSREKWEEEKYIETILENVSAPIIPVYTKTDLPSKIGIPKTAKSISSYSKEWFEDLLETLKEKLPTGPILFPDDVYTKQDMYFRISEIIREKVFLYTKEELPHSTYIEVEELNDNEKILKIIAYVYTESDSQKYIIVGKWWQLITKIGKEARIELEDIFEKKVFLALRVKVMKNWRKNEKLVKKILN